MLAVLTVIKLQLQHLKCVVFRSSLYLRCFLSLSRHYHDMT